jgi:hypothetical protein
MPVVRYRNQRRRALSQPVLPHQNQYHQLLGAISQSQSLFPATPQPPPRTVYVKDLRVRYNLPQRRIELEQTRYVL